VDGLIKILEILVLFVGGAGAQWLFTFRSRRKKEQASASLQEHTSVDDMVRSFRGELKEMTDQMSSMNTDYLNLLMRTRQETEAKINLQNTLNELIDACNRDDRATIKKICEAASRPPQ
jgi:hypothetical protein